MLTIADRALPSIQFFNSSSGARIYQIPLKEFPMLWGFAYLVLVKHEGQDYRVLVDTGSGFGESNRHLEAGLKQASELSGEDISLETLTHILITHGHIDHFGGLGYVRERTPALVGVHELDLRNLTHYEERIVIVSRRLENFLAEAGVPVEERQRMIAMYKSTKSLYHSVKVDFTYEAVGMRLGPFEFLHVPGHCAGHVVIRLDNILFSGDHVLEETSPHQSPEHLTLSTGLEHYLRSLDVVERWVGGSRLALGGHKDPVSDIPTRIAAIRALHQHRLGKVMGLLSEPHTIAEVSDALFGDVSGYNILLALEEAGAHVEYLYQRGLLAIANLDDIDRTGQATAILYQNLSKEVRSKDI